MNKFAMLFVLAILIPWTGFCQGNTIPLHAPDSQVIVRKQTAVAVLLTMYSQDTTIARLDSVVQVQAKQIDTLKAEAVVLVIAVDSSTALTTKAVKERDNAITNCNKILGRKEAWTAVKNGLLYVLIPVVIAETTFIYLKH